MSELYPTPTRIQLLRDVEAGDVKRHWGLYMDPRDVRDHRTVTADMKKLHSAGWVRMPPMKFGGGVGVWELTDKGREILAGAS